MQPKYGFNISGIQQVGVGTENFRKSWNWFIRMFGTDVKILEDDTVAERMLPYTGNQPQKRHACIAVNLQGGGGFEIWQYSERKPQPVGFDIAVGDLGVFAAKLNCRDIPACHKALKAQWDAVSDVSALPDGTPCFYVKDLFGNCFQLVQTDYIYIDEGKLTGGMAGTVVGVTDMDKSIAFYREILGYDTVKYDETGVFADWSLLPGADGRYRRVLMAPSKLRQGAFSALMGPDCIELVQALDRTPRKIYEGRYWGDPGFIQICYDVTGMRELEKFCAEKGHPFTVDSCPGGITFDMGDASGHFTYIEDPDGTLIEFVETHKVPVVKKLGWYIDMKKRDPRKPLPKFLFRAMGPETRGRTRPAHALRREGSPLLEPEQLPGPGEPSRDPQGRCRGRRPLGHGLPDGQPDDDRPDGPPREVRADARRLREEGGRLPVQLRLPGHPVHDRLPGEPPRRHRL